jgi:uncharacterized YceG family protein
MKRFAAVALLLLALSSASALAATPKPALLGVLFPEGYSARQMVDRVAAVRRIAIKKHVTPKLTAKAYAAAVAKAQPPVAFRRYMTTRKVEGFLFPSLYKFGPADAAAKIVQLQLTEFGREWKKVGPATAHANPYERLTVASMVEREAALPGERPVIAAVIYNRLARGMPLGIDATIRYGLGISGTRPLTTTQLQTDSPYNTRLRTGLPPTPISNPGLASLRAAARPANVDYLYYVRIPGTVQHYFTADDSDFCAKVLEYGYGGC